MTKSNAVRVAALLLALAPAIAWSDEHVRSVFAPDLSGGAGLGFDSNIGNTPSGNSPRAQTALDGNMAAAWRMNQGLHTAWQLRASLDATALAPTTDLSEARATVRARWLHRPGNGFFVPIVAAWVSAGARASGSDLRNGADYRAGAFVREQLTTAVTGRLGYAFSKRVSESRVYDLTGRTITLGVDWIATPTMTVYAELERYHGHIVSSVVDSDDEITLRSKSYHYLPPLAEEIEADEAYGANWFALKLPATANSLVLGLNQPLWAEWSLDSRLQFSMVDVTGAPSGYSRGQLAFTLLRRF